MARFTVDTHLFRELGELLVGRDSTALIELIKNAYDADANEVIVYAEALDNASRGFIRIKDNGLGMTPAIFEDGFLRIASRVKDLGDRKSAKYGRRYTGAKGIGRLAAHKLARELRVSSIPDRDHINDAREGVDAAIHWDEVEKYETLESLDESKDSSAISVQSKNLGGSSKPGTTITLSRLRKKWTLKERARFIDEVQTFTPPEVLVRVPKSVIPSSLLFDQPKLRVSNKSQDVFSTKLQGEFAPGDDYWQALSQAADWIVEIDASADPSRVRYNIAPTKSFLADSPDVKPTRLTIDHPYPDSKLSFQARILVKEGSSGTKSMKAWAGNAYGIRVFLEGFRVLPYGEKSNDWLSLDLDYAQRTRRSVWLESFSLADESADEDALLVHLPNRSYFGGIFVTVEGAQCLRMLVNREGFVPDSNYDGLVRIVRVGIDLATRARAAAKSRARQERKALRSGRTTDISGIAGQDDAPAPIAVSVARAKELVHDARQLVAKGEIAEAQKAISVAEAQFEDISDRLSTEGSMLRVLASVGTQMGAFVHEINALLGMAESLEAALSRIGEQLALSREHRREIAKVQQSVADLRRHLERQASYLVDVVTPDSRRRRTRMSLADRFDAGKRLVEHIADRRKITISNEIPGDLKSPPMFPAELTTVFSNLLTNAVKAAGENGKIRAWAQPQENTNIIIENTGVMVKPEDGERWFLPFESTTASVDAVLGQGMGLGLPITRSILEQYGAEIRFASPSRGYATAVTIIFPNK